MQEGVVIKLYMSKRPWAFTGDTMVLCCYLVDVTCL